MGWIGEVLEERESKEHDLCELPNEISPDMTSGVKHICVCTASQHCPSLQDEAILSKGVTSYRLFALSLRS
jgi:hypothetical protein